MDLELSSEQVALRDTVRSLLAAEAPIAGYVRPIVDGAAWTVDAVWARLAELGAMGVLGPERSGGMGLGLVDAAVVAEELGRALFPGPWVATVAASRALTLVGGGGSDLLARIASGQTIGSLATRSSPARPGCQRTEGLGAPLADVVLVPRDGRLLAVDGHLAAEESIDRTQPIAIVPDDAAGPDLGAFDDAAACVATDALLVLLAADALGAATAVMEVAVQYAKDRHQFGQPIGAFQSVAHLCVDMLETVEMLRGGVLHAAWAADAEDPGAHLAAVRLKASSDRLLTVAETAIQVLGGIGYTWEHDAQLFYKRLMTWSTFGGSASTYRVELARSLAATP